MDANLTSVNDPPLSTVVEIGERAAVRTRINRKVDQWEATRLHLRAAYQAAPIEPRVTKAQEDWFPGVAVDMHSGLDRAGRFEPSTRRIRCMLAFGQLEHLSQRWLRLGWANDHGLCLEILTGSWCRLLCEQPQ